MYKGVTDEAIALQEFKDAANGESVAKNKESLCGISWEHKRHMIEMRHQYFLYMIEFCIEKSVKKYEKNCFLMLRLLRQMMILEFYQRMSQIFLQEFIMFFQISLTILYHYLGMWNIQKRGMIKRYQDFLHFSDFLSVTIC